MRKLISLLSCALLVIACSDVQAPQLELPAGPSLSRGPANAPFQATLFSATERHTCAVSVDRGVYCWGSNEAGQLGTGSTGGIVDAPVRITAASLVQVSVGGAHSCGLDGAGVAYCWGGNRFGALGNGTTQPSEAPAPVDTELRFKSIGAGNQITCALTKDGAAYCWGANGVGALGTEVTESCALPNGSLSPCSTRPVAVSGGHVFADLQVGLFNACGLDSGGAAHCWGNNSFGQLGVGTVGPSRNAAPRAVAGGLTFAEISVGAAHMCGLSSAGAAYCWGYNAYGQLGNGTFARATTPTAVQTGGRIFTSLVAGDGNTIFGHSCASEPDGSLYCWGANSDGQLGVAAELPTCGTGSFATSCSALPLPVETELRFTSFELGSHYSCAISSSKRAYCWGNNDGGALGNPAVEASTSTVTPVAGAARGRSSRAKPPASRVWRITDL